MKVKKMNLSVCYVVVYYAFLLKIKIVTGQNKFAANLAPFVEYVIKQRADRIIESDYESND